MEDSPGKIYLKYTGPVLYDTIGDLIGEFKETMFEAKVKQTIFKKVLMIMIESLENIFKYHEYFDKRKEIITNYPPGIIIHQKDDFIVVKCFNPIKLSDIGKLESRLDHINSLDKSEVKLEYKQTITNGQFSEKGGAGLGIIEMAKISDDKLDFSFEKINKEFYFFTLTIKVKNK